MELILDNSKLTTNDPELIAEYELLQQCKFELDDHRKRKCSYGFCFSLPVSPQTSFQKVAKYLPTLWKLAPEIKYGRSLIFSLKNYNAREELINKAKKEIEQTK